MVRQIFFVGCGGFLGSIARYLVTLALPAITGISAARFPIATLAVNTLGCLAMGAIAGLFMRSDALSSPTFLFLSIGVLGGFTTFSAFGLETFQLLRSGQSGLAVLNVTANLALGFTAVLLGRWVVFRA